MFESFSGAEILTIAVIALVVFGPHRLPEIARTIGGYLRELRSAVTELRQGIEQEIGPLREPIKEIKQDLAKPVSDVRQTLAQTADAAKAAERDIRHSATKPLGSQPKPTSSPGPAAPADSKPRTSPSGEPHTPPVDESQTPQHSQPETPPVDESQTPQRSQPQTPPASKPEASPESAAKTPQARWIAPEPPTGVSPSDVWEGMGDPMPKSVHPPASTDPSGDLEEASTQSAGSEDDEQPDEEVTEQDVQ